MLQFRKYLRNIMVDINLGISRIPIPLPKVLMLEQSVNKSLGFPCESCELIFKSKTDLISHNLEINQKFSCSECGAEFRSYKVMKQHFGKKHEKLRPYCCSICNKKFRNVYAFRIHKKQVHFHESRKICTFCDKELFNKYSLSRHMKSCKKIFRL